MQSINQENLSSTRKLIFYIDENDASKTDIMNKKIFMGFKIFKYVLEENYLSETLLQEKGPKSFKKMINLLSTPYQEYSQYNLFNWIFQNYKQQFEDHIENANRLLMSCEV